jgi:hypothetical protein
LNDLSEFVSNKYTGLVNISNATHECVSDDVIGVCVKLFLLLCADDTVLSAESKTDLQNALNAMSDYCNIWNLVVNEAKTKVVVFSKSKPKDDFKFMYNGKKPYLVDNFTSLGVLFKYIGKVLK